MSVNYSNDNIKELIDILCSHIGKLYLPAGLNEHSLVRKKFEKDSAKHLWNLLLFNSTNKSLKEKAEQINGANRMLFYSYELKKFNQNNKSIKLQELTLQLSKLNENHADILEFLVDLKPEPKQTSEKSFEFKESIDSLCLYDKFIQSSNNFKFDMLSKLDEIKKDTNLDSWQIPLLKKSQFNDENLNIKPNIFTDYYSINTKNEPLDNVQQLNKNTLFSALVSKKVRDDDGIDLNLDIPDLPEDVNLFKWQIPTTSAYEWIDYKNLTIESPNKFQKTPKTPKQNLLNVDDEGFYSSKCSPSMLAKENLNKFKNDDLWEKALKFTMSDYIDWDMREENTRLIIGIDANKPKKYLLIDSPRHLFDQFYYHYLNTINILVGDKTTQFSSHKIIIKESQFIRDCLNVLISLPSISFIRNQDDYKFEFNSRLHISGVSSESLACYSEEFCQIGTFHSKILDFIKTSDRDLGCGSTFRSFINAIKLYLKFYNERIIDKLKNINNLTVVSLYLAFKPTINQLRFLVDILKLNQSDSIKLNYLRGADLIFYLYNLAKECSNTTPNFKLILHLLTCSLAPFFNFIEKWIFQGKFSDQFDEFFIDFNYNWINSRDKNYFLKAFSLKEKFKNINQDETYLIKHLYEDIFNCGKSLALLKLCDPENFMCKNKNFYPKLILDFNQSYLKKIETICNDYNMLVIDNSKYKLKTRKEYIDEQNKIAQERLNKMQLEASERFKKYQEKENEERKIEAEKKKQRFDAVKDQMETDLKRRADEKLRQKKEDKEYMEKLLNRDFELTEKQKQLEKEVKEEIIKEYEELTKNAEEREASAKARIEKTSKEIQRIKEEVEADAEVKAQIENIDEPMETDVVEEMDVEIPSVEEVKVTQVDTLEPIKPVNLTVEDQKSELNEQSNNKLVTKLHVNDQTIEKTYKPSIKFNNNLNALSESPGKITKPAIKFNQNLHHSTETDMKKLEIDDQKRIEAFKARNVHGHSSQSKIQNLMYLKPDEIPAEDEIELNERIKNEKFRHFTGKDNRVGMINFDEIVQPYQTDFNSILNTSLINESLIDSKMRDKIKLCLNSIEKIVEIDNLNIQDEYEFDEFEFKIENEADSNSKELFSFNYIELEEILNRILYKPVQVELTLINKCLINYFLFDLKLEDHLKALRQYLLFENGIFAQKFVDEILERISFKDFDSNFEFENIISPIYVSEAFNKTCALVKNCKYIDNLSIRINKSKSQLKSNLQQHGTSSIEKNLLNFLNMIELIYNLEWPLNIIINESNMKSYNQIFGFLLQIKFVLSALNNVWYTLRRFELIYNSGKSFQLKQLKLFCHEMQHYMSALQNYIYNQVIHVTWQELQKKLNDAQSVDDLIETHLVYLKTALSRCFFTKKREDISNVIQNIFGIILKFRSQLVNTSLTQNEETKQYEHELFGLMQQTYQKFKSNVQFLHKILQKGISVGYEYHLNNLALTLNYNFFYGTDSPVV